MILLNTYSPSVIHVKAVFNYTGYGYYINPAFKDILKKSLFNKEFCTNNLIKSTR